MTAKINVELVIDNCYQDGEKIQTLVETQIEEPPFPLVPDFDSGGDDYCDWEQDEIFPHTGADYPEGGDAGYFVKVASSSRPDLIPVGTEFEFC